MSDSISDYHYDFPPELVAQEALADREASRMMVLDPRAGNSRHARFRDFPDFITAKDILVVNDTAVFPSRFFLQKPSGGKVELFLLRNQDGIWDAFLSPRKSLQAGMKLPIYLRENQATAEISVELLDVGENPRVQFASPEEERQALACYGETPLPPYIRRDKPNPQDRDRYQTLFAEREGAVAAPTAGLHFGEGTLKALKEKGVSVVSVTLHVGPGTFLPVKCENLDEHPMHSEWYEIPEATRAALERCRERGGRIFVVGTTALRALESYAVSGEACGWTDLFIRPGFRFRLADALLTNFHQPRSTLLVLVSAFAGKEFVLKAYAEAVREGYRLWSYGDCMLMFLAGG